MDALVLARPLALLSAEPWVLGQWYQKALYLLVDLKRYDRAYAFAHEALKCFVFTGCPAGQAGALIEIELKALVADVTGWIHKLKASRKLRDLVADFAALEALGDLDGPALEGLCSRFQSAKSEKPRKRRSRKDSFPSCVRT